MRYHEFYVTKNVGVFVIEHPFPLEFETQGIRYNSEYNNADVTQIQLVSHIHSQFSSSELILLQICISEYMYSI